MMTNQYRVHRCSFLPCWAIIGMLCIAAAYAGCADSPTQHTNLAIDNLRVDSITEDLVTVAFSINQPATIFWTLYAHNAPLPRDIDAVISDARSSLSDPMIVRGGVQEEDDTDAGTHTIRLANLPSPGSYNLYVAAASAHGSPVLADALPITTVRNISDVDITRIDNETIQINWTNPSARTNQVLDKIVIDWDATNRDGESATSRSYSATDILTANAKTHAILPISPTRFIAYRFSLAAQYRDGSRLPPVTMNYRAIIDDDGDGLIDIYTLEALNDIRCNPSGTAYQELGLDGVTCLDFGVRCGIDGASDCTGYELRRDLNFSEGASYATGRVNPNWRPNATNSNRGWLPIERIFTVFEGNGHTIEDLYVRDTTGQDDQLSGLFARISGSAAHIRNLTLKAATIHGGHGNHGYVGGLAGELSGGTIENVAVIGGRADGNNGQKDRVGGLIGQSAENGTVRNSYASATVYGGAGWVDYVGGLVGYSRDSTIIASYATGNTYGIIDISCRVGGLVGQSLRSTIISSYATGNVDGGGSSSNKVGGLIGANFESAIIASYATGNVDGGGGNGDRVGGLIGHSIESTIVASYATGNVDGGGGKNEFVGGLIGGDWQSTIVASYATGNVDGGRIDTTNALLGIGWVYVIRDSYGFGQGSKTYNSPLPTGASRASDLTAPIASNPPNTAVPHVWDSVAAHSKDAWDFGTSTQRPALRYADYDGDGNAYNCDQFPAPCGTLIPGQR